jgi:16S rRNA C1402 N4-methylase RsmH
MPHNPQPATDNLSYHTPVLLDEVGEGLQVKAGEWYVDATVGGGGHSLAILQAGGKVLGVELEHRRPWLQAILKTRNPTPRSSLSDATVRPQSRMADTRNPISFW